MLFGLLVLAGLYWFTIPGNLLPCMVPCREHRFLTFETQLKNDPLARPFHPRKSPAPWSPLQPARPGTWNTGVKA